MIKQLKELLNTFFSNKLEENDIDVILKFLEAAKYGIHKRAKIDIITEMKNLINDNLKKFVKPSTIINTKSNGRKRKSNRRYFAKKIMKPNEVLIFLSMKNNNDNKVEFFIPDLLLPPKTISRNELLECLEKIFPDNTKFLFVSEFKIDAKYHKVKTYTSLINQYEFMCGCNDDDDDYKKDLDKENLTSSKMYFNIHNKFNSINELFNLS